MGLPAAPRRCLDARKAEGDRSPLPALRRPFDDPLVYQGDAELVGERNHAGEVGRCRLVSVRTLRRVTPWNLTLASASVPTVISEEREPVLPFKRS